MDLETTVPDVLQSTDSNVLQFTVKGDWGHFKRVDTTTTKQTYHVIPRTTTTGLIACILGLARDSYYELFSPENTAIAVSVENEIRLHRMARNEISTTKNDLKDEDGKPPGVLPRESTLKNRQQRLYQYLCDPKYTFTVAIRDDEMYNTLKDRLTSSESVYTISLGTAHCLAHIPHYSVEEVEHTAERCQPGEIDAVDSVVPMKYTSMSAGIRVERSPRVLTEERTCTEFGEYAYHPDGKETPVNDQAPVYRVGDSTVVFY